MNNTVTFSLNKETHPHHGKHNLGLMKLQRIQLHLVKFTILLAYWIEHLGSWLKWHYNLHALFRTISFIDCQIVSTSQLLTLAIDLQVMLFACYIHLLLNCYSLFAVLSVIFISLRLPLRLQLTIRCVPSIALYH